MGWYLALLVGGIAGGGASIITKRIALMGILLNIVVGCVGAVIGNLIAGPVIGIIGNVREVSFNGLIAMVLGAVVLLGFYNDRGRVR